MRDVLRRNFIRIRREKGLSQIEISEAVGTSHARIVDIEKGTANPTITTLFKLAQALGVEPAQLLELNDIERRTISS